MRVCWSIYRGLHYSKNWPP